MAFIDESGKYISFDCSDLIVELKEDIAEFGGDTFVFVWCKKYKDMTIYTNYDFDVNGFPIKWNELKNDESICKMSMSALLLLLEKQNSII